MRKIVKSFPANRQSVDRISADIKEYLTGCKVTREICLIMSLAIEDVVLNIIKECGENIDIELKLSKSIGKPWITLSYRGKKYNPVAEELDEMSELILNNLDISPIWTYRSGLNRITYKVPAPDIRSEVLLVGAVALALFTGVLGGLIPAGVKAGLIMYILSPISSIFMSFLMALAPMLIFLSVLTSIARGGDGADFNKIGKFIISRYIGITAIMVVVFTGALIPFFNLHFVKTVSAAASFEELYELIMNIFPGNIVAPFAENNTMQIIILSILLGIIILRLDNRIDGLRTTLQDLHTVFLNAVEAVCRFLPIFVFASLTKLFWENGFGSFAKLWKPIGAAIIVEYGFVLLVGIYVSVKFKVPIALLFKKLMPSYLVGLTTGSSLVALTNGMEVNKDGLGISEDYSSLAYPLGISLYVAPYSPLYIAITYYMAEVYKTPVSVIWFVIVAMICMVLAFASPQVSGGALICLGILMTQLNIPSEGLAVAGSLALLLDFFSTGAKVLGQHLEMTLQAGKLEMIDVEVLRRK